MGGAGMFSTSLVIPMMGRWFDKNKAEAISNGLDPVQADQVAGSDTLMKVAIMPAVLLVAFIIIYLSRKKFYAQHKADKAVDEMIKS